MELAGFADSGLWPPCELAANNPWLNDDGQSRPQGRETYGESCGDQYARRSRPQDPECGRCHGKALIGRYATEDASGGRNAR